MIIKLAWLCSLLCAVMALGMSLVEESDSKISRRIYSICNVLAMIFLLAFASLTIVLVIEGLYITVG